MEKVNNKINRRKFCACMLSAAVGLSGSMLLGCSEDGGDGGEGLKGFLTLTVEQVSKLKADGYINIGSNDGAMVFYTPGSFTAYTRDCPHEGGLVTAQSKTSSRCGKHTGQYFDISNSAKGNGNKTTASLTKYTTVENADGTLTINS